MAQGLGTGIPHSLLAFVWFLFGTEYPTKMKEFFRAFSPLDGDPTDSRHPAQKLRDVLREQHSKAERLRYAFAAVNSFLDNERPRSLKIDETSSTLSIGNSGKTIKVS